jgi:L-lactate dehydrogenase
MTHRIGIIGTGWVGTSVAISTLLAGVADELWLNDARGAVAQGEAMDLLHGAAFYPHCQVRAVSLEAMREADIVVVAAGRGGRPGESRLDLLRDNARVVAGIGRALSGFGGLIVMVTNPVDVLTRVMAAASGLPPERVMGTGTFLDTARLHQQLGASLGVSPQSVHAQVIGEHGDSEVVLWSSARVGGVPVREWAGWSAARELALAHEVRTAAYEVIQRKGATNHAIGLVTARLLGYLLRNERRLVTVSRVQTGACGLQGVALSLPTIVGSAGAMQVIEPHLDEIEREGLMGSAGVLHRAFESLAG